MAARNQPENIFNPASEATPAPTSTDRTNGSIVNSSISFRPIYASSSQPSPASAQTSIASTPAAQVTDISSDIQTTLTSTNGVFTLFPELPAELRVAVWNACFPDARTIYLDHAVKDIPGTLPYDIDECAGTLPVTRRVNHESRLETLKHYIFITPPHLDANHDQAYRRRNLGTSFELSLPRTICWNLKKDHITIRFPKFVFQRLVFAEWFPYLQAHFPDCLASIERIELTDAIWSSLTLRGESEKCTIQRSRCFLTPLRYLTGLKEIRITLMRNRYSTFTRVNFSRLEAECKTVFVGFLELYKEEFASGKAPSVVVI